MRTPLPSSHDSRWPCSVAPCGRQGASVGEFIRHTQWLKAGPRRRMGKGTELRQGGWGCRGLVKSLEEAVVALSWR